MLALLRVSGQLCTQAIKLKLRIHKTNAKMLKALN
jgi:hypothetical protein